jgi:hypothetical protein
MISFTRKTNSIHFNYHFANVLILCTNCVMISVLYWTVNCIFMNYSTNFCFVTFFFLGKLKVLYVVLIRLKLQYTSVTQNNLNLTHSKQLENIQKKIADLYYSQFYQSWLFSQLWLDFWIFKV